jgi:hypothetical protein
MGIPSDVARGSKQSLARAWSVAFHEHPAAVDGILYASRLNGQTNIALYGRAVSKLRPGKVSSLLAEPEFATILTDLKVGIAPF